MVGSYSPIYRGTMVTSLGVMYPFFGAVNGYYSSKLYSLYNSTNTSLLMFLQVFAFPTFLLFSLLTVDLLEWVEGGYVMTLPGLYVLLGAISFLLVNAPFVYAGSWLGRAHKRMEAPVKPNRNPRDIPNEKKIYLSLPINMFFSAILPSMVIYYELAKILQAIQGTQNMTILFWFVYLALVFYVVVVAEINMTQTYVFLCHENYNWWWRSYILGAAPGLFFFGMAMIHLLTGVRLAHYTSILIYVIMAFIASSIICLISGAVAFFSSLFFVTHIYSKGVIKAS